MPRRMIAFAPLLLIVGCAPKAAPTAVAEVPAVSVTVAPIQERDYRQRVLGTGTLNGTEDITLSAKVDGVIRATHYEVGDLAIPGAVLLEIDTVDLRLAVDEAQAALDSEMRALSLTTENFASFDANANDAVIIAKANLDKAEKNFEPYPNLRATKAVSEFEFLQVKLDFDVTKAKYRDTIAATNAAYARAKQRRVAVAIAEQHLADAVLRVPEPPGWKAWAALMGPTAPPLRYTVVERMKRAQQRVQSVPITDVYRLVMPYLLNLLVTVPERHAAEVRVGQPVEVRVDAYGDKPFAARVARVNPTIDPLNRTFQVEIEVPNVAGNLKPGGFAQVAILGDSVKVVAVPPQALVTYAGVSKVFVLMGDKAQAVPVEVGIREKDWIEVKGAFPAGAPVLTSGFSQVVDGSRVEVRK